MSQQVRLATPPPMRGAVNTQTDTILVLPVPSHANARTLRFWMSLPLKTIIRCIVRIRDMQHRRRALRAFLALDDRVIADLGLYRSQLEYVVRQGRPLSDAANDCD